MLAAEKHAAEVSATTVLLDVWYENNVGQRAFERMGFKPLNLLMSKWMA